MVSTTSQTIGGDKAFQGSTLFNNALTTVDSGSNGISGFRLSRMINESSNLSVGDEPY